MRWMQVHIVWQMDFLARHIESSVATACVIRKTSRSELICKES